MFKSSQVNSSTPCKLAIITLAVSIQQIFPSFAQSERTNAGYYPVVYATRELKAGSFIANVADIGRVEKRLDDWNQKVAFSPSEVFGYKTKRNIRKNQIIGQCDLDFKVRLKVPTPSQQKSADAEYITNTFATRNIAAGSFITSLADLGVIKTRKNKFPTSVFSPREILGYRVKTGLRKDEAIGYADIDFNTRLDARPKIAQVLNFNEQLKAARMKWPSASDDYWESFGPKRSDTQDQGGAIVVATKRIKKGSVISNASDIELIIVPQSYIPAGAISSPFRAISGKAKYDFAKNSIISMQDLDFSSQVSAAEKQLIRQKVRLAGHRWTGISADDFSKQDHLLK